MLSRGQPGFDCLNQCVVIEGQQRGPINPQPGKDLNSIDASRVGLQFSCSSQIEPSQLMLTHANDKILSDAMLCVVVFLAVQIDRCAAMSDFDNQFRRTFT